ncbi:uncharacterized protein LOC122631852 isoform X1 [Vespula pensylvanica]|uniref:uncharacterized protein LOC122631852 isoform X1 n=1 Tax=Vespula pensylvanica TaxID=30213 RepID=UPI001CBA1DD8|nr:uncharacterized protein LOC122631852 isoform X1 [Vespula pensylvanica]
MYNKAIALRTTIPQSSIAICYIICIESLYLQIGTKFLRNFVNRYRGPTAFDRLELASYLARLSSILMIEKKEKLAKSIILQSLRLGFENSGNFLKQAKIYLATVKVLRRAANFNLIKRLENLMIEIITKEIHWFCPEDVMFISDIFMAMYEIRALRGEFEKAIEFGKKILKIACTIKFIHVKLALLPSFIEIMVWTKHISEAIDLINELYYISDEDIDSSAITWYYALSLELLLEAGIFLESYESCFQYAKTIVACNTKACVSRDPICLTRLLSGLWIWQLRMGYNIDESFEITIDTYTTQVEHDNFSAIVSCSQVIHSNQYH